MPFTQASRKAVSAADKYWAWKFSIRAVVAALAVASIGILAWTTVSAETWGSYSTEFSVYAFIPLGVTVLFFLVHVLWMHYRNRPVHPGWNVGVDLILIIMLAVLGGLITSEAVFDYGGIDLAWEFDDYHDPYAFGTYPNGSIAFKHPGQPLPPCWRYRSCDEKTKWEGMLRHFAVTELAGCACMLAACALHCVLFVWACVDTEHHRRRSSALRIRDELIREMRRRGEIAPAGPPLLATDDDTVVSGGDAGVRRPEPAVLRPTSDRVEDS